MHKIIRTLFSSGWTILFLVGWLGFMILASGTLPFGRGPEGEWETITHPLYNFSIEYPTKWRIETFEELGRRGRKETKLNLYDNLVFPFFIQIWLNPAEEPALDDVIIWYDEWIEYGRKNVVSRGGADYEELSTATDFIQGEEVFRKTYSLGGNIYDVVYLARSNDMIVIEMQVPKTSYNQYLADFNRIANSFTSTQ